MADSTECVPNEKIESIYKELEKLQEIASQDLVIDEVAIQNFEKTYTIYEWVVKYNWWKKRLYALQKRYNKIRSIKYFQTKNGVDNIYDLTDKEVNLKVDADDVIISYQNTINAMELVIAFIQKIQALLDSQRYDIKDRLNYLIYLKGEDFSIT